MRIGVISDTHGDQVAIRQILKSATHIDMWLHAGDCSQDAEYLAGLITIPVIAVKGNCDGHVAASLDEVVTIAGQKVWITHGHRYGVKRGIQELVQISKENAIQIVIYGHTHIPDNSWHDGIFIFNPGSANCCYGSRGTYGIIEIHNTQILGNIIEL